MLNPTKKTKYTLMDPYRTLEAKKYTLAEPIVERNNVPKQHFSPGLASKNNDVDAKFDDDDVYDGYNAGNDDDDNYNIYGSIDGTIYRHISSNGGIEWHANIDGSMERHGSIDGRTDP